MPTVSLHCCRCLLSMQPSHPPCRAPRCRPSSPLSPLSAPPALADSTKLPRSTRRSTALHPSPSLCPTPPRRRRKLHAKTLASGTRTTKNSARRRSSSTRRARTRALSSDPDRNSKGVAVDPSPSPPPPACASARNPTRSPTPRRPSRPSNLALSPSAPRREVRQRGLVAVAVAVSVTHPFPLDHHPPVSRNVVVPERGARPTLKSRESSQVSWLLLRIVLNLN